MRKGLIFATTLLASCSTVPPTAPDLKNYMPADINAFTASNPVVREAYANQSTVQYGELRLPQGKGPFPVAMLVHGGCWANLGSIANMGPIADWLADHGVATWNVDYRELKNGGGWPETYVDWAAGLSYLQGLSRRYPLDLDRLTVIGHSAGTTPAVWLGSTDHGDLHVAPGMPRVRAGILLDGPIDLKEWVGPDENICRSPVIANLMGGTPAEQPDRYAMVDPRHNPPKMDELLVVVGSLPPPGEGLLAAIEASGTPVKRVDLDGTSHFNMIVPGTPDFAIIAPELLRVTGGK